MRIRVLAGAQAEIDAAAEWYEQASEGLGDRFRVAIDAVLARVATKPGVAPVWLEDPRYHCLHLRGFPYTVFLRPRGREWIVVAVTHQRRRPGAWRPR